MTGTAEPDSAPPSNPTATALRVQWWVAALTFVGGLVVGVLAVGLLTGTTPDFGAGSGGAPSAPTTRGGVPVVAEARVNAACLSAINEAQDMYTVLTDVGPAAQDVDLQQLDDIVRRLQPIQGRLGPALQNCRVDTSVANNASEAPSTPLPTSTPTR